MVSLSEAFCPLPKPRPGSLNLFWKALALTQRCRPVGGPLGCERMCTFGTCLLIIGQLCSCGLLPRFMQLSFPSWCLHFSVFTSILLRHLCPCPWYRQRSRWGRCGYQALCCGSPATLCWRGLEGGQDLLEIDFGYACNSCTTEDASCKCEVQLLHATQNGNHGWN